MIRLRDVRREGPPVSKSLTVRGSFLMASALNMHKVYQKEDAMKVFDDQVNVIEVGQKAADFRIAEGRCLSCLEGFPLFFVFWKTL